MNYRHCILILVSLAGMAGCDQLQPVTQTGSADTAAVAAAPAPTGPVLATVNGTAITQGAYEVYSGQRKPQGASEAANNKEAILNELVALELMRQESVSKGLDTKAEVIAALDQQNRTTLAGAAIKEFMSNNSVTDEDAQAFYDAQMATPAKEFNARHILVKTEDDAVAVIAELDNGADFSELAKEKSTGPSGASGGKLGWFGAGQMVKPFADAAAGLEKGAYTKTPVQTQFGWHVIVLDDTRDSTPPPFEDVKERLKMLIANQKLQQHIEAIKADASIEIK